MEPIPLFIDVATGRVRASNIEGLAPVLTAILGTALNLSVGFVTDSLPGAVDVATSGILVVKKEGDHTADPLLMDADWVASGSGTAARYLFTSIVTGEGLQALLVGKEEIQVMAQVEWTPVGEDAPRRSYPFSLKIVNSYLQAGDAPAPAVNLALVAPYYRDITGLTGGGATKLDGLPTTALAARTLVLLVINDGTYDVPQHWMLYAGTTAEDAGAGIVRPDDYATTTNEKVWQRIS